MTDQSQHALTLFIAAVFVVLIIIALAAFIGTRKPRNNPRRDNANPFKPIVRWLGRKPAQRNDI